MVFITGLTNGTLYKQLVRTIIEECNSSIVPKRGDKEERTPTMSRGNIMRWRQIWDISKKTSFEHYKVNVWLKVCLFHSRF